MEIIKIFNGGYINKDQVIDDGIIIDKINAIKKNVIFDETEHIFKTELEKIDDEDIFKLMKSKLETDIESSKIDKEKKQLRGQLTTVNNYLKADTTPEEKARHKLDLKKLFEKTLLIRQDEIRKTKKEDYIKLFNSIVPFQPNSEGNLFSFLELTPDNGFIILDSKSSQEIYSKPGNEPIGYYKLEPNFTLIKYIYPNEISYNYKIEGYPLFPPEHFSGSIIEAQLLNGEKIHMIINYYSKYLKEVFNNWLKHFGSWDRLTATNSDIFSRFYFSSEADIMKSFMISHFFIEYYEFHRFILFPFDKSFNFEPLNNPDLVEVLKSRIRERRKVGQEVGALLEFMIYENRDKKIKLGDNIILSILSYINNFKEVIGEKNLKILHSIISQIHFLEEPKFEKLFYTYNFYKLNTLYKNVMADKSWNKTSEFFDNINNLNEFIKFDIKQVKLVFYAKLIEELYDYHQLMINMPSCNKCDENNFGLVFIWYLYFWNLKNTPIVEKLTNMRIQFHDFITKNEISRRIQPTNPNYIQLIKFYKTINSSNSELNGFIHIPYSKIIRIAGATSFSYCGEVSVLHFLLLIMFDTSTKKLKSEYLPTTILEPIKKSLSKFNEIKEINQSNIQDFYSLLENIPFERVSSIGAYDYDISGNEYTASRRIYRHTTMNSTHFINGMELRMNYFNFCRIISYLFNSTGELELGNIQKGVNEDTLKKLLGLINNPNKEKMISSYSIMHEEADFHSGNTVEVKILNIKFTFQIGHSFPTLLIEPGHEGKIVKTIPNYKFSYGKNFHIRKWDILKSIYISYSKGNNIFSEINCTMISETDYIKFLDILKNNEDYNIPSIVFDELFTNSKDNVLKFIYNNFKIIKYGIWYKIINYFYKKVSQVELCNIIDKYLTNCVLEGPTYIKTEILVKCLQVFTKDNFIKYEKNIKLEDYIIINKLLHYIVNDDLLDYIYSKITSVVNEGDIRGYVKQASKINNINYTFLDKFDKSFFNTDSHETDRMNRSRQKCLIFFALKINNINLIKFLLKKKVNLPEIDARHISSKFNYDERKDYDERKYYNIFISDRYKNLYLDVFDFVHGLQSYDLIRMYDSTKIKHTKIFNIKLIVNCLQYLNNPPITEEQTDEKINDTLNLLLVLFEVIKSGKQFLKLLLNNHISQNTKMLILRKMYYYVDWKFYLELISKVSKSYNLLYITIISENYERFKTDIFTNIKKEDIFYKNDLYINIKMDDKKLDMLKYTYFPFIFDLYLNNFITTDILIKYIFIKENLLEENIDKILKYFREKNDNSLYFMKLGNNLIMNLDRYIILYYYKDIDGNKIKQFLRLFGFLLKNIFKSPIYNDPSLHIEKKTFVNFLEDLISLMLKLHKSDKIKTIDEIHYRIKIVSTILETHQVYLTTLHPSLRTTKNFLNDNFIKNKFRGLLGNDFIIASREDPVLKRLQNLVFPKP